MKKMLVLKSFVTILCLFTFTFGQSNSAKVVLLNSGKKTDPEISAVKNFLDKNKNYTYQIFTPKEIISNPEKLENFDLIWYHRTDTTDFNQQERNKEFLSSIKSFVNEGGGLLLTLDAFKFINTLGIESNIPERKLKRSTDNGFGRMLGFHSKRNHPVFAGLNGGSYIYKPTTDIRVRQFGFFENNMPKEGKVVAVDWDYIFLRENKKVVLEYSIGKGKVLAVGGYTIFNAENVNQQHLETFTNNTVAYLTNQISDTEISYWDYKENKVIPFENKSEKLVLKKSEKWNLETDEMTLKKSFASEDFYDVAGQRFVMMGKENGGIDEVWAHPFMALRDYEVGVKFSYADTIYWFNDQRPEVMNDPEGLTRIYKFKRAYITEVLSTSVEDPVGSLHYEYRGVYDAKLYIKFKSNFRNMWPYSENMQGSIYHDWDENLNAFVLKDESGKFGVVLGSNKKAEQTFSGRYGKFVKTDKTFKPEETKDFYCSALIQIPLAQNENVDVVISASNQSLDEAVKFYRSNINSPLNIREESIKYYDQFENNKLLIHSPENNFNLGYKWAVAATDKFFVHTPGLGKSLVAGYSTTATGWDGGHKINGRPGYAWYFGRDAVWSCFAFLGYGDFEKVRDVLAFLQKYQDLNGKILHELSTSGFVHYDASDATPLYLILAGRYLRYSGDVEFIKESWPYIKKAIDFCISTDTDKDHLIENTNVGHGWVEGGSLFGTHTSLYLASCWADALSEINIMAKAVNETELADYAAKENKIVSDIIENEFWNEKSKFYYQGRYVDGSYHKEPTILTTMPLYFGLTQRAKASEMLDKYASNEFTSDWGVRIVSEKSKLFRPHGYHTGSVWPLFTGWTSLAEYKMGNTIQGFSHIMNNLNVYKSFSNGYVEEVLNGVIYKPSGVCRHQCWSQTMVLQPIAEGLLGVEVNALENRITISPAIPMDWNTFNADNIRLADKYINLNLTRETNTTKFDLTGRNGIVNVNFKPVFPAGTEIKSVKMNGRKIDFKTIETDNAVKLDMHIELTNKAEIVVNHSGGIQVIPLESEPRPGSSSKGFRVIKEYITKGKYNLELEGLSSAAEQIEIFVADSDNCKVTGGEVVKKENNILTVKVKFDKSAEKYSRKVIKVETNN